MGTAESKAEIAAGAAEQPVDLQGKQASLHPAKTVEYEPDQKPSYGLIKTPYQSETQQQTQSQSNQPVSILRADAEEFRPVRDNSSTFSSANAAPSSPTQENEPDWARYLAAKWEARERQKDTKDARGKTKGASIASLLSNDTTNQAEAKKNLIRRINDSVTEHLRSFDHKSSESDGYTSEYLKLLRKGQERQQVFRDRAGEPDAGVSADGTDAIDHIIQTQNMSSFGGQNRKKRPSSLKRVILRERQERGVNDPADEDFFRKVERLSAKFEKADDQPEEVEEQPTVVQDDINIHQLARSTNLAEVCYYSSPEDEVPMTQPTVRKQCAHIVGQRPRNERCREYVTQELSHELDGMVAELLTQLKESQDREKVIFSDSARAGASKRRYVVGLREVARGVKLCKIGCVLVAPDIEEIKAAGGLDERVNEILQLAYDKDIPVVFALNRFRIGKSIGKRLRMSVVGIYRTKGSCELFDKILSHAYEKRMEWLDNKKQELRKSPKKN